MTPWAAQVLPQGEAQGLARHGTEGGLELSQKGSGGFGCGLVLDDDVGVEGLAVLHGKMWGEAFDQGFMKGFQG